MGADEKAPDVGIPEELAKFYFAQICEGMVSPSLLALSNDYAEWVRHFYTVKG